MSDINTEWVEKSAQALHDMRSRRSWALHEIGQPLGDTVYDDERRADARAALEAVADDLRAEGAAALREQLAAQVEALAPDLTEWRSDYRDGRAHMAIEAAHTVRGGEQS